MHASDERPGRRAHDIREQGWVDMLLYLSADGRLTMHLAGSGHPTETYIFRSGAELGDFIVTLLDRHGATDPILAVLRDAVRRLPLPGRPA